MKAQERKELVQTMKARFEKKTHRHSRITTVLNRIMPPEDFGDYGASKHHPENATRSVFLGRSSVSTDRSFQPTGIHMKYENQASLDVV